MKNQKIPKGPTRSFNYIQEYKNPDGWTSLSGNNLTRLVRSGNRDYRSITVTLLNESAGDRDINVIKDFLGTIADSGLTVLL